MANNIKELEKRKAEIVEKLGQLANNIIAERDNLAAKIHEVEAEVAKFGQVRQLPTVTEDIYNPEAVLAAGVGETKEEAKKRLAVMVRAYATNPFCDKRKAAAALEMLEELGQIAAELDSYYNGEVAKTGAALELAKKAHKEAQRARTQHQRETVTAQNHIRRAGNHSIIGVNELLKYGVEVDSFSGCGAMLEGVGYDGKNIVESAIAAIERKAADMERLRNTPGRVNNSVTTMRETNLQPGEPAADMTSFRKNGFSDFWKSFSK